MPEGVRTRDATYPLDIIVFATGFDAMTGTLFNVDIRGRAGLELKAKWAAGPRTYLGLMSESFPNLFMITGPQSPSVLSNMVVSIEQHVDWITDCLVNQRAEGFDSIEPTQTAVDGWVQHTNDFGDLTLMYKANSWYVGANVPGKPRVLLPYTGGVGRYRMACNEVAQRGYLGFERKGAKGAVTNDGVIKRLMPDVEVLLEAMATMDIPLFESMSAADARAFGETMNAGRPAGPEVGEMVDGTLPGADGKPLGLVEAKRTRKDARVGQQQAKLYADCLEQQFGRRPVIFYSNGYEHWMWDDLSYPPRPVQGFYKKDELQLLVHEPGLDEVDGVVLTLKTVLGAGAEFLAVALEE